MFWWSKIELVAYWSLLKMNLSSKNACWVFIQVTLTEFSEHGVITSPSRRYYSNAKLTKVHNYNIHCKEQKSSYWWDWWKNMKLETLHLHKLMWNFESPSRSGNMTRSPCWEEQMYNFRYTNVLIKFIIWNPIPIPKPSNPKRCTHHKIHHLKYIDIPLITIKISPLAPK